MQEESTIQSPSGYSGPRWAGSEPEEKDPSLYSAPPEFDKPAYFDEQVAGLPSMEDKMVAITGCTTGTGYALAKYIVEKGGVVFMLNRDSARAEAALSALSSLGKAIHIPCDLTSFESVRSAAAKLESHLAGEGLDVLCCNAGVMGLEDTTTSDGFEVQIQVNHLSHFLLTSLAWPLLECASAKRGDARVVSHSSGARKFVPKGRFDATYLEPRASENYPSSCVGNKLGWILPFQGPRWNRCMRTPPTSSPTAPPTTPPTASPTSSSTAWPTTNPLLGSAPRRRSP